MGKLFENRWLQGALTALWLVLVAGLMLLPPSGQAGPTPVPADFKAKPGTHFVALGDTGSGVSFQFDVAQQMQELHRKQTFDTALLMGDIIYPAGEIDKYGEDRYLKVYRPLMERGVRFYPVLGNHDVLKGYSPRMLDFYDMPGRYYTFSRGDVAFFAIDTNIFTKDEAQQKWLDKRLATSPARWKVVYGHHPVYSSGEHGNSRHLKAELEPILVRHNVDFYLAGHDHNYERMAPIGGVVHIVSGGGGAYLRGFDDVVPTSRVRRSAHHFLHFRQQGDTMELDVIDKQGRFIDQTSFSKPARRRQELNPAS